MVLKKLKQSHNFFYQTESIIIITQLSFLITTLQSKCKAFVFVYFNLVKIMLIKKLAVDKNED